MVVGEWGVAGKHCGRPVEHPTLQGRIGHPTDWGRRFGRGFKGFAGSIKTKHEYKISIGLQIKQFGDVLAAKKPPNFTKNQLSKIN